MVNWTLESCCGDAEALIFLGLYGLYTVLTYFLMETIVAKPLKLIAIFIHEMGQYVYHGRALITVLERSVLRPYFLTRLLYSHFLAFSLAHPPPG